LSWRYIVSRQPLSGFQLAILAERVRSERQLGMSDAIIRQCNSAALRAPLPFSVLMFQVIRLRSLAINFAKAARRFFVGSSNPFRFSPTNKFG
jgi:hypothetical protein